MPRKRNYDNDYPSVTQVLDGLRKPALEYWFKANTPQFIEEASRKGKTIGTQIHEAIDHFIATGELKIDTEYPDEVTNALKGFALFRQEHPEIILRNSEKKMTSEKHQFNGTMDIEGENGCLMVGDWKTGQAKEEERPSIYDEYRWQVSAYVNLFNEVTGQNVNRAFIVALAKDKVAYNLDYVEEAEIVESFENVFLPALKICQYKRRK